MKTKHLVTFLNRAAHFEADIELVDVLTQASDAGILSKASGPHLFDSVVPARHPRLAKRKSSDHNRRLAVRHLRASLCASYIKDLYEDFGMYMQDVLEAAARNGLNPNRLIGAHRINVEASELLATGSWEGVVHMIASSIFRKLEDERNTKSLIQAMDRKLGLDLDPTVLDAALPYFELRHLLVHKDGVADGDFCQRFPAFGAVANSKISVEFTVVASAQTAVVALAKHFDSKVVANSIVASIDLQ